MLMGFDNVMYVWAMYLMWYQWKVFSALINYLSQQIQDEINGWNTNSLMKDVRFEPVFSA